jgi:hypothetical protein
MKICLVEFKPSFPKIGILEAYSDVVDSYYWGFLELGFNVERRINSISSEALNIVFGFQIPFQMGIIDFPENTIFHNLERYSQVSLAGRAEEYIAKKYQIWDYSVGNINSWIDINPKFKPFYAKIPYAPNLEKISNESIKDIDILYYGNIDNDRIDSLRELTKLGVDLTGLSVVTLCNVWGRQRDDFISRAKIVINLTRGNIFEIVRVSYLMANKVAVVSDYIENLEIEEDIKNALFFLKNEDLQNTCVKLINDSNFRSIYSNNLYNTIKKRDVRSNILDFFNVI